MANKLHAAGMLDYLDEPTYRSEPPYDIELWGSLNRDDIVKIIDKNISILMLQVERMDASDEDESYVQAILQSQADVLFTIKREIFETEQRYNAFDSEGNER